MDKVNGKLTVYFAEPFWVGVFERIKDGKLSVAKVTFGAEPKDYEVLEYVQKHYAGLKFSLAVDTVVIRLCNTMMELDFSDSLNQVSCPVLVICGEKDKANKKASIELAHSLKYSQFKEIPETGHEVNLESPEKLASLLQEFYNSI